MESNNLLTRLFSDVDIPEFKVVVDPYSIIQLSLAVMVTAGAIILMLKKR